MNMNNQQTRKYLRVSIKIEFRRVAGGEFMAKVENLLVVCEAHQFTQSGSGEIEKYFSLGMKLFSANINHNPAMAHYCFSLLSAQFCKTLRFHIDININNKTESQNFQFWV